MLQDNENKEIIKAKLKHAEYQNQQSIKIRVCAMQKMKIEDLKTSTGVRLERSGKLSF